MTQAEALKARYIKKLEEKTGIKAVNNSSEGATYIKDLYTGRVIEVREVYRHNGTKANCSIRIRVLKIYEDSELTTELYITNKITKSDNADEITEAVINNFLYSGKAPAQEGLNLFFKQTE